METISDISSSCPGDISETKSKSARIHKGENREYNFGWEEQIQSCFTWKQSVQVSQKSQKAADREMLGYKWTLPFLAGKGSEWDNLVYQSVALLVPTLVKTGHISRPEAPSSTSWRISREYFFSYFSEFLLLFFYKWNILSTEIEKWIRSLLKHQ